MNGFIGKSEVYFGPVMFKATDNGELCFLWGRLLTGGRYRSRMSRARCIVAPVALVSSVVLRGFTQMAISSAYIVNWRFLMVRSFFAILSMTRLNYVGERMVP